MLSFIFSLIILCAIIAVCVAVYKNLLYPKYQHIFDPIMQPYILKYTIFIKEFKIFLACFKSWAAFKDMLYRQDTTVEETQNIKKIKKPELSYIQKVQQEKERIEQQLSELNAESNGMDILKREVAVQPMPENNPEDMHPRAFELCMLIEKKDAELRKMNKDRQALQKKMMKQPVISALGKRYQINQTQ
jgi:hypothetical protein